MTAKNKLGKRQKSVEGPMRVVLIPFAESVEGIMRPLQGRGKGQVKPEKSEWPRTAFVPEKLTGM